MSAAGELLVWAATHGRDLPWRTTRDPYRILVSEVMLQQTQAERVVPFYQRFIERFPDAAALAKAGDDELHRLWKGLGYPSRADRLRTACQTVVAQGWPEDMRTLPGVGPYTAAAVGCFAFGRPTPPVDTNLARVYARREALPRPVQADAVAELVRVDLQDHPSGIANALMDLGATICTARAAQCDRCPWAHRCRSRGDPAIHAATSNPLKVASTKRSYGQVRDRSLPHRVVVLGLCHHDGRYLVAKRPADRHAGGMWELPGGKREVGEDDRVALARELTEELGVELLAARHLMRYSYNYPDRALTFQVYRCRLFDPQNARALDGQTDLRWVTPQGLLALSFPPANAAILARLRRYHRIL
ncbi:A/G-specific adenine glycosylase [Planctomycetota bacterium]|nr:A/G-specific adenine glycosylase [Planctomycetota bacterium]